MKKIITITALLILAACGKHNIFGKKGDSTVSGDVGFTPAAVSAPQVGGLFYMANGSYVRFEYPANQIANYTIEFCSSSSYSSCSRVITINCPSAGHCVKGAGQVGTIANSGSGSLGNSLGVVYTYTPQGQTFSIRVRATSGSSSSLWLTANSCSNTQPAQCQSSGTSGSGGSGGDPGI